MQNKDNIIRWYDNYPKMIEALNLIEKLSVKDQNTLAGEIIEFVNFLRKAKDENKETAVSIGTERVFGLYKTSNGNRWYDKNVNLRGMMNIIATLPDEDLEQVAQGIINTINNIN